MGYVVFFLIPKYAFAERRRHIENQLLMIPIEVILCLYSCDLMKRHPKALISPELASTSFGSAT
jgi:hypothetical protein